MEKTKTFDLVRLAKSGKDEGLTAPEAIVEANRRHLTILFNGGKNYPKELTLDGRLTTDIWESERNFYPAWANPLILTSDNAFGEILTYEDPKTYLDYRLVLPKEFWKASGLIAVPQGFDKKGNPNIRLEGSNGKDETGKRIETLDDLKKYRTITYVVDDVNNFSFFEDIPTQNGYYIPENSFGLPVKKGLIPFLANERGGLKEIKANSCDWYVSYLKKKKIPFWAITRFLRKNDPESRGGPGIASFIFGDPPINKPGYIGLTSRYLFAMYGNSMFYVIYDGRRIVDVHTKPSHRQGVLAIETKIIE